MAAVTAFKLFLILLIAIVVLHVVASRLRLPPAAALLIGGIAMAFIPGVPVVKVDPDLVLLIFMPPLLMDGAWFTVWHDFRRNLSGILLLAIGAVLFTTLCVGAAVHGLLPALPWGACFALGAIVSPPDAVAAKTVLERVVLPRQLMVLLEGESLLNDAAGLVLYRFAIAAALTGAFNLQDAFGSFILLGLGGAAVGVAVGWLIIAFLRRLHDVYLMITTAVLAGWGSYIAGELCQVSGVTATIACGMLLGWHQHEVFPAATRTRGTAFWQVFVFLLEALVFLLIGLSLRGAIVRVGGVGHAVEVFGPAVGAVVGTVIVSRFVWVFARDYLSAFVRRLCRVTVNAGDAAIWRAATVKSWAGMRGVVTLAIALELPEALPGRDLAVVASFAVILVTVLLQGMTIGPLIRWLRPAGKANSEHHWLTEPEAWARLEAAQFDAIVPLVHDANGNLIHPRLYEQYGYRKTMTDQLRDVGIYAPERRQAHYDVILAAVAAGRAELLNLHRSGLIHDELLHVLEYDLDLQEISAVHGRGT